MRVDCEDLEAIGDVLWLLGPLRLLLLLLLSLLLLMLLLRLLLQLLRM